MLSLVTTGSSRLPLPQEANDHPKEVTFRGPQGQQEANDHPKEVTFLCHKKLMTIRRRDPTARVTFQGPAEPLQATQWGL